MLYWQIEKELQTELDQAIQRFRVRYGADPCMLLINKEEEAQYKLLKASLNIKTDKLMQKKHFGLL